MSQLLSSRSPRVTSLAGAARVGHGVRELASLDPQAEDDAEHSMETGGEVQRICKDGIYAVVAQLEIRVYAPSPHAASQVPCSVEDSP